MVGKGIGSALAFIVVLGGLSVSFAAKTEKGDEGPNPTVTTNGTRGLVHIQSAETMGAGRLSFSLFGSWYKQDSGYTASASNGGTPNKGSNIITGSGTFSFGVNPFFDVFALGSGFGSVGYEKEPGAGIGSVQAGVMGALPLPESSPVHLGTQVSIIGGTSANQIDSNKADGYDYFETRTGYDFMVKILESVVFGTEKDKQPLLLLGLGLQGNVHELITLGLEINSRTFFDKIDFRADPLWVTPSIVFRTPFYMNFVLGGDVAASQKRTAGAIRSLELFRIFGGMDFTFDLYAGKRRAEAEAEHKAALEKEGQQKKEIQLKAMADSLSRKVKADSIATAQARETEKRRADSLAQKAKQDSVTLAETKLRLREELSKRSDMEKQLLSTGLLLLDAVYFETGKTEISINSKPYLNIIGKMLLKYPKLLLEIGGHTDNIGGYEANKRLSYARAGSVRQYLVFVAPDLATRLTATGYGLDVPKADNRSAAGRKVNRRVELQVMNKEVLKEYNP
jgi:outer membrane protein OmpA-like peptidoglycan-associated protein